MKESTDERQDGGHEEADPQAPHASGIPSGHRVGEILDRPPQRGDVARGRTAGPAGPARGEKKVDRLRKVPRDRGGNGVRIGLGTTDEHGPATGRHARRDVSGLVADHPAAGEVETEIPGGLQEHARLGFAPRMLAPVLGPDGFGVVRAVVEAVDETAATGGVVDESRDLAMHAIHVLLRVATSGHAALVGHHDQSVARLPEAAKAFGHTVEQFDARGISQVAAVGDQGVVSIQEHNRVHAEESNAGAVRIPVGPGSERDFPSHR